MTAAASVVSMATESGKSVGNRQVSSFHETNGSLTILVLNRLCRLYRQRFIIIHFNCIKKNYNQKALRDCITQVKNSYSPPIPLAGLGE